MADTPTSEVLDMSEREDVLAVLERIGILLSDYTPASALIARSAADALSDRLHARSSSDADEQLRGEIAYALTKRLIIDLPTARAVIDEAFALCKVVQL